MLLSEAIRLGAMLRPQGRIQFFPENNSCALGAAMEAVGLRNACLEYVSLYNCDDTALLRKTFPVLACEIDPIFDVAEKNDEGWTRERIADWVESIERERGMIPAPETAAELVSQ